MGPPQETDSSSLQGEQMNTGKEKPAIVIEPAEDPITAPETIPAPQPVETPAKEPATK